MVDNGISVAVFGVGALLVVLSLVLIVRKRLLGQMCWSILALVLLAAGSLALLGGLDMIAYKKILAEEPIATLAFQRTGNRLFRVDIVDNDGQQMQLQLEGDQWQMDVRLIKWGDSLAALGASPLYRLDRISGRYADIRDELSRPKSAHSLQPENDYGLDVWLLARRFPQLRSLIDTQYGSATFLPMADGAIFRVSINGAGLVARPANDRARTVVAGWN